MKISLVVLLIQALAFSCLLTLTHARVGGGDDHERWTSDVEELQDAGIGRNEERHLLAFADSQAFMEDNEGYIQVMVGYLNRPGFKVARGLAYRQFRQFRNLQVVSMIMKAEDFEMLESNENIE
jgi:hypothetical protein